MNDAKLSVSSPLPRNKTASYGNSPITSIFDMRSNCMVSDDFSITVKRSFVNMSDNISRARVLAALRAAFIDAANVADFMDSESCSV